jgi:hypothetical protein
VNEKIIIIRFYIVMTIPPNEIGDDDDETNVGIYDATFSEPQTSFLTLFRMMLGSFDMIWFQKKHDRILTLFAYLLFIICKVLFFFFFSIFYLNKIMNTVISLVQQQDVYILSHSMNSVDYKPFAIIFLLTKFQSLI